MLVQFSVGNYRSFRDVVTFSMVSSKTKELSDTNIATVNGIGLLKSGIVYGANASGKSNLVKALDTMIVLMKNSSKESQANEDIPVEPFRLSTASEKSPCFFELVFIASGTRYRYGFEVDRRQVHREWLYHVPRERESNLFKREGSKITISGPFKEGKGLEEKTRENSLFLSVVAQFNGSIARKIMNWLGSLNVLSGIQEFGYAAYTISQLKDPEAKSNIVKFIKAIDLGIEDINVEEVPFTPADLSSRLPEEIRQALLRGSKAFSATVSTTHKKYDDTENKILLEAFDMHESESEGTKKMFALAGPIVDTLKSGKILVVDELDAKLHPLLTRFIIHLFNSVHNKQAQLIFNTHDINLLDFNQLRRDQIWFTEKDVFGATGLYSLIEYNVRNNAPFRKDYMAGKYGGIPIIDEVVEGLWGEG